jgi:hypothetical protein
LANSLTPPCDTNTDNVDLFPLHSNPSPIAPIYDAA